MGSRRRGTSPAYDFTEWDANEQQPFTLSPCASSHKFLTQKHGSWIKGEIYEASQLTQCFLDWVPQRCD